MHISSAAVSCLDSFIAIEPHDIGEKFNLFGCKFAVGAVNLLVDVASVDEEYLVAAVCITLASVKEPERTGQRHCIEEVGAYRDHYIDDTSFDQFAADVQF